MKIGTRIDIRGAPLAETLGHEARAVRRELRHGLTLATDTAVGYWRGSTPKRTGDLRRSERGIVDTDAQGRITTKYHVTQPGADYYVEVADLYPHLEDLRIVDKWTRANERKYIDIAIRRGLKHE